MERMKLLVETSSFDDVELLVESATETKAKEYKIRGPFVMCEQKNRNGRIYPINIVEPEVNNYIKEKIETKSAYGNCDHPASPSQKLEDAAIVTTFLKKDGNNFLGEAKVLSTPKGRLIRSLMDDGCRLAVSTRGLGTLNSDGIVGGNFRIISVADVVSDPSASIAVVESIVESFDYIIEGDKIIQIAVDNFKKDLDKHGQRNLAQDLQKFISGLRSKI
jgi:hypothetical protein